MEELFAAIERILAADPRAATAVDADGVSAPSRDRMLEQAPARYE